METISKQLLVLKDGILRSFGSMSSSVGGPKNE